jgi:hypothetical protein
MTRVHARLGDEVYGVLESHRVDVAGNRPDAGHKVPGCSGLKSSTQQEHLPLALLVNPDYTEINPLHGTSALHAHSFPTTGIVALR